MYSKINKILDCLACVRCKGSVVLESAGGRSSSLVCTSCSTAFPIVDGIPRFVSDNHLTPDRQAIEDKTGDVFGFQWDYFDDWGFIPDLQASQDPAGLINGSVSSRKQSFSSKVRLTEDELDQAHIVLDAGCGNGRYTFEASSRSQSTIIGVDIGQGAVQAAAKNCGDRANVVILQASLFNLPFRTASIGASFSNGVLMHTGDARAAFSEVARTLRPSAPLVVNVYNYLNPIWELNDRWMRLISTRLSISGKLRLARALAALARRTGKSPRFLRFLNLVFRLQPSVSQMFDWYSAPVASHHSFFEVCEWFTKGGFNVEPEGNKGLTDRFWTRPWAVNVKGYQNKHDDGSITEA